MKKVTEIAKDFDVTRQTIYNWIDKLSPEIDKHIDKVEGVKMIDNEGVMMIADKLDIEKGFDSKKDGPEYTSLARENELLREQLEYLKEQIDRKDNRLDRYQILLQQKEDKVEYLKGEVEKQNIWQKVKDWFK